MKTIRIHQEDPLVESYEVNDLVWVSCQQLPFDNPDNQVEDGLWDIPCELARVEDLILTTTGEVWGLGIESNSRPGIITGIYKEDVMQNLTQENKKQRQLKAISSIEKAYHRHYTVRKIAANRIKRAYIRHYWNPENPLMKARLLEQYRYLTDVIG
jgi:hypothetical protein